MSMINNVTRFAVTEAGKIFCYLTSRHMEPTGILKAADGQWDLAKVKEAILAGKTINTALVGPPVSDEDKVAKADEDFNATVDAATKKAADELAAANSGSAAPAA